MSHQRKVHEMKDFKTLLKNAGPDEVQDICDEMVELGIELEEVADEEKDYAIFNKVARCWKPNLK